MLYQFILRLSARVFDLYINALIFPSNKDPELFFLCYY